MENSETYLCSIRHNISFLVITTYMIRAFGMFSTDEILEKCVIVKGKVCYVNFTQQLLISYLC